MIEVTRDSLHQLVDRLPESEQDVIFWVMVAHLKRHEPLLWFFMTAPEDDEEVTEEERIAIEEAWADIRAGRIAPLDEVAKEWAEPS